MRCEIKHWEDNKKKTAPLLFKGRPWRTVMRYLAFLDDKRTSEILNAAGGIWDNLP